MCYWRDIPSTPGYQVSAEGEIRKPFRIVRGKRTSHKPKILKQSRHVDGYMKVCLWIRAEGRRCTPQVHTLVAEAFLGPRPPGHEVHHKNLDRADNRACNLQYITKKEKARLSLHNHRRKLSADQVRNIRDRFAAGEKAVDIYQDFKHLVSWPTVLYTAKGKRHRGVT